jgi:hypothetical protein
MVYIKGSGYICGFCGQVSEHRGFCSPSCYSGYKQEIKKNGIKKCITCKRHYSGSFLFCGEICFQNYLSRLKTGKIENKEVLTIIDKYPIIPHDNQAPEADKP